MGQIEPSRGSKQSACEHNPAGSPQIIQSPPYQTPDDDSANYVAKDGHSSVVTAVGILAGDSGRSRCPGVLFFAVVALSHGCCPRPFYGRCRSAGAPC